MAEHPNDTTEEPTPTIFQLMPKVSEAIGAIGKGQTNTFHNYRFRGIDDVYNAVSPALRKHGVTLVPTVLTREVETHTTSKGKAQRLVSVEVQYRFFGPSGDYLDVITWGEGMDAEDKGTNKALSAALKYALFNTFLIPTEEAVQQDADRGTDPDAGPDALTSDLMTAFNGDLTLIAVCLDAYQDGCTKVDDLDDTNRDRLWRGLQHAETRDRIVQGVRIRAQDNDVPDSEGAE